MTEFRTFTERDRAELLVLFRRAGRGSPTESLWGHEESEAAVYLVPYMDLEPESLFLAFADGEMVGYLAGCLDSTTFPAESERMRRAMTGHRLFLRRRPLAFFLRAARDGMPVMIRRQPTAGEFVDPRWPAHLHINVAPRARGTGAAAELMNRWLQRVAESGASGCHLQTLVENTRAVRFFASMGFVKYGPVPQVPGIRYRGRRVHQQTMVWPAPGSEKTVRGPGPWRRHPGRAAPGQPGGNGQR
ncbi:GNAT family N-acetyltransferase [Actinoplanes sp. RD1]|uniref:GNAT family N-acetyltransferase n=1 Tax=Actinoplanes sp. RD1 TaxID=3064538 RepID=UPI002741F4E9|nr:GNAT family N-acetyltransferase [Actinoplanes sp. RD1]